MHINTTYKTISTDYFTNTENVAFVHVTRTFDSTDALSTTTLVIENLGQIIDVFAQVRDNTGGVLTDLGMINFQGNVITFSNNPDDEFIVSDGHVLELLVVGKR